MPFDTGEGPNQPILLNIPYALYPHSQPTKDFSVVLPRFLRYIEFAAGNRNGWLISDTKGGSYPRSFTTNVMMINGLSFASSAQTFVLEGSPKRSGPSMRQGCRGLATSSSFLIRLSQPTCVSLPLKLFLEVD